METRQGPGLRADIGEDCLTEPQVLYLYKQLSIPTTDNKVLEALKTHFGNEAGTEPEVSSPYCPFLPCPHFCSQSTKPSEAVTLPRWGRVAPAVPRNDIAMGMEEMHEKEFQEKHNLGCLGAGRSLTGTVHAVCVTAVGSWLILTRRKNVPQRKGEFTERFLFKRPSGESAEPC